MTNARLPLQGGLPPVAAGPGPVVEIACDESGFSGTNLLGTQTPVFTHASVDLTADQAGALLAALPSRFSDSPGELKAAQLLRGPQAAEATDWLLGELAGRAHVVLVDKEYFVVTRIVDLLLVDPSYAAGTRLSAADRSAALALHRSGRAHPAEWSAFLATFVGLVRTKRARPPLAPLAVRDELVVDTPYETARSSRTARAGRGARRRDAVGRFFGARDALLAAGVGEEAAEALGALSRTRVSGVLARLAADDRSIPPPLEPLLPALAETVLFWSAGGRQVLVSHDEQSALTAGRLTRLQHLLDGALVGLVTVDSRDDARVQVADLLAGLARRSPGAPGLAPFVSPTSLVAVRS